MLSMTVLTRFPKAIFIAGYLALCQPWSSLHVIYAQR
jgi:hypothetical protein